MKTAPPPAILSAVLTNDANAAEAALRAGETPTGWRALVAAVANGASDEILALLVQHGADPSEQDARALGPLHHAVHRLSNGQGRVSTVRLLLEAGADPLAPDENERTPLHWAARGGAEEFELLLDAAHRTGRGVPANVLDEAVCSKQGVAKIEAMLRRGAAPDGESALVRACGWSWPDTALRLIEAGASIDKVDRSGASPLHLAAAQGHEVLVRLLLERGARTDVCTRRAVANTEVRRGDTPADVAVRRARWAQTLAIEALVRAALGNSYNVDAVASRHSADVAGALKGAGVFCARVGSTAAPTLDAVTTEVGRQALALLEGAERIAALLGASLAPQPLQVHGAWKLVEVKDGPRRGSLELAEGGRFTAKLWTIRLRGTFEVSEDGIGLSTEDGPLDASFDGSQLFLSHPLGSEVVTFVFEPPRAK